MDNEPITSTEEPSLHSALRVSGLHALVGFLIVLALQTPGGGLVENPLVTLESSLLLALACFGTRLAEHPLGQRPATLGKALRAGSLLGLASLVVLSAGLVHLAFLLGVVEGGGFLSGLAAAGDALDQSGTDPGTGLPKFVAALTAPASVALACAATLIGRSTTPVHSQPDKRMLLALLLLSGAVAAGISLAWDRALPRFLTYWVFLGLFSLAGAAFLSATARVSESVSDWLALRALQTAPETEDEPAGD